MFRALPLLAIVTLLSPGIQTTGTPPADTFVTLAESSLYGSSGSLINMTGRISPPVPLERPDTSGWATNSTITTCSSDITTFNLIWGSGGLVDTVADETIIQLPNCTILIPHTAAATGERATIPATRDRVVFRGQANTKIRMEVTDIDWASSAASGQELDASGINVGPSSLSTPIADCVWNDGFGIGTRMVQLSGTTASGTGDCTINATGGNEWGPGDIVRLTFTPLSTASQGHFFTSRIACVRANDGTTTGTPCNEITGNNQIQLVDPLPMDYADGAYQDTATITGRVVQHMERVGSGRGGLGSESNNIAEYVGFENITFERKYYGLYESLRPIVGFRRSADGWMYGNRFENVGASVVTASAGATRVLYQNNVIMGQAYNARCYGEVTSLTNGTPVQITVTVANDTTCPEMGTTADHEIWISEDSAEPNIAGKYFPMAVVTGGSGTGPTTYEISLLGTSSTNWNTNPGGLIAKHDDFSRGVSYCFGGQSNATSNIQFINNAFKNVSSGPLIQDGCSSHVMFGNYVDHDANSYVARTEFPHGNAGAPGPHFEMNDIDGKVEFYASSNRAGSGSGGEGRNRTIFKNRLRCETSTYGQADTCGDASSGGRGTLCTAEQADQAENSNEDWNVFENVICRVAPSNSILDSIDNAGDNFTTNDPPHMLYALAFFRNRTTSATNGDLDIYFGGGGVGSTNSTTLKDTAGNEDGENAQTVPGGWVAEAANVPTSIFYSSVPSWWCTQSGTFGEFGAHYDDTSSFGKLPAQILYEGTTCTPP